MNWILKEKNELVIGIAGRSIQAQATTVAKALS